MSKRIQLFLTDGEAASFLKKKEQLGVESDYSMAKMAINEFCASPKLGAMKENPELPLNPQIQQNKETPSENNNFTSANQETSAKTPSTKSYATPSTLKRLLTASH